MSELLRKLIPTTVKEVGERTLSFIGSDETLDRDGDIIMANGWDLKNFRKNPVFMWAHDYGSPPIGRATKVSKADGQLVFEVEFADKETFEFADTIFRLFKGGFLHATSVGFISKKSEPIEDRDDDENGRKGMFSPGIRHTKQELLELSAVPVPSNPAALVSARDAGTITDKEFNGLKATMIDDEEWEDKTVVPFKHYPLDPGDAEWDGPKEVRAADVDQLRKMSTWFDSDNPDTKSSYKLPHHRSSNLNTVWRAVAAAGAATMGARGGVDIPENDIPRVQTHLGKHYKEFDRTPPWKSNDRTMSQNEIGDELGYLTDLVEAGLNEENQEAVWEIVRQVMRLSGADIPVDIQEKVGAVLNNKNKSNLKQAQALIQTVLDSADNEEPKTHEPDTVDAVLANLSL